MQQRNNRRKPGIQTSARRLAMPAVAAALTIAAGVIAASPTVAQSEPTSTAGAFTALAATSSTDVWAVGYQGSDSFTPLAEHYDGKQWKQSTIPGFGGGTTGQLEGVAATAPDDVWAVGVSNDARTKESVIEHFDGKSWSAVKPAPVHRSTIMTFTSASSDPQGDVWMAGFTRSDTRRGGFFHPLVEEWNGSSLSVVPTPDPGAGITQINVNTIEAVSPTDVWAGGYSSSASNPYIPLAMHYDGTGWTVTDVATPAGQPLAVINSFTALSPDDIWAVGLSSSGNGFQPLTDHFDGTRWSVVDTVQPPAGFDGFVSSAGSSTSDVWAGGAANTTPLVAHWNGSAWKQAALPKSFSSGYVAALTTVTENDVWGAGFAGSSSLTPVLIHWNGKHWTTT